MKISPAKIIPPFARPLATFDRPSQSFADVLSDAAAQREAATSQAFSFGAKGLFGTPTVPAGLSPSSFGLEPTTKTSDFEAADFAETVPTPLDLSAEPDSVAAVKAGAPGGLSSADLASNVNSETGAVVGGAEADGGEPVESVAEPTSKMAEMDGAGVPEEPEAEIDPEAPRNAGAPEPQAPMVLISGEGEVFDVHMTSLALSEIDKDRLRRRVAETVTDHGWLLQDVRLNGELLTTNHSGGIDG